MPRVGAPPERVIIAVKDFLIVHPVRLAVENLSAAVGREFALRLRGEINYKEVLLAHKCDPLSVRAKGCQFLRGRGFGQTHGFSTVKGGEVQIVGMVEK